MFGWHTCESKIRSSLTRPSQGGVREDLISRRPMRSSQTLTALLLQESPGRDAMGVLGKKLFGVDAGILSGVDASLIVRGRVIPADLAPELRRTSSRRGSFFGRGPRSR